MKNPANPRLPITSSGESGDLVAVGHGVGTVVGGRVVVGRDVVVKGNVVGADVAGAVTTNWTVPMKPFASVKLAS